MNAWLAAPTANGIHRLTGDVTVDAPLIVPSNRVLDARDATITLIENSNCNILMNANAVTPQRTIIDLATTAGSTSIRALSAVFAPSDIGRTLVVDGAGGNGNGPLTGVILSVPSSAEIILSEPATATVTNGTGRAYIRDQNISIHGGLWSRGGNGGSGNNKHGLLFRHVDNLDVEIDKYTSTGPGKYAIAAGDIRGFRLALHDAQTTSDGVHITGPASSGSIPHVAGNTQDDMLAFTCGDYAEYADVGGDILDVSIGELRPRGAMQALKVLAGAGRRIDGLTVHGGIQGNVTDHAVWVGDGYGGYGDALIGGQYGTLDLGSIDVDVAGPQFSDLYLVSPAASKITARIRHSPNSAGNVSVSLWGTSRATIKELVLDDCDWSGTELKQAISVTADSAVVEQLTVNRPRHHGAGSLFAITSGMVGNLLVQEGQWVDPGSDGTFFVNGGEISSITAVECNGEYTANGYGVRINKGAISAVTFRGGRHSTLHSLIRSFSLISGSINLDHCTITTASRVAQLVGESNILLMEPTFDHIRAAAFHVTVGPFLIEGDAQLLGNFALIETPDGTTVRVAGPIAQAISLR
ncbi:hypothetical protein [Mycobacterium sp. C31M]